MNKFNFRKFSRVVFHSALLLCTISLAVPRNTQSLEVKQQAWAMIMQVIPDRHKGGLYLEDLPNDQHANLVALLKEFEEILSKPTAEEVRKYSLEGASPEQAIPYVLAKGKVFLKEKEATYRGLIKAAGAGISKKLIDSGTLNQKSPATIVIVPMPCPSDEVSAKVVSFLDTVCKVAQERQLNVVVVTSAYGDDSEKMYYKWEEAVRDMPKKYAKYVDSGTLKFVKNFARATNTPWGFLFRNGELVDHNNVAAWDSKALLKEFSREALAPIPDSARQAKSK